MLAVEFHTSDLGYACARGLFARKVLTAGTLVNAKTIRFEPAAVISEQDIQDVLSRMDEALAESDLEKSYELWKNAQWDGTSGITQDGDLPWIWLVNIDHLYWVKDGLQVAEQKLHPHGHGWSIVNNVDQWTWK